jgi:OOP family OmpA-OmpF porin
MPKLKTGPKIVLAVVGVGAALWVLRQPAVLAHLPSSFAKAVSVGKVNMPKIEDAAITDVKPLPYPSDSDASIPASLLHGGIWEWNAQLGMLLANGGKTTKRGSQMEKFGVNLALERQDDTGKMQDGLVACAKELKDGAKQCSSGYNFVVIMGGGSPQFVAVGNSKLRAAGLGPEWNFKTYGAVGRSNGEDGCWAPESYKSNPHSIASTEMKDSNGTVLPQHGLLIEAVVRDDDYNICVKHAGDNGVLINPDEKTFDPNAVNFLNTDTYITAATDYVAGKCEDRKLVQNGHPTGKDVHICVNGVATWFPGDEILATKRGGLVPVATSKDYLMSAVLVGPGKFLSDNHDEIVGFLSAVATAGDQVRAFPEAKRRACKISVDVYDDKGDGGDANGSYWCKGFDGYTARDATGTSVRLGGSAVYGLADMLKIFGIKEGANDDYRSVYNSFAAFDNTYFPTIFKKTVIPAVSDVEIKSYMNDAKDRLSDTGTSFAAASTVDYGSQASGRQLGDANYHINFATGSAVPLPDGVAELQQLRDSLAITSAAIEVSGHTDNTGNSAANEDLSRRRAQAVADFLHRAAPSSFPNNRFRISGYGDQKPVASNATADGRAQNRRVEIVLRSN